MSTTQMQVSSSLMQNYRLATPFKNDTQIACVGGMTDQPTVFSIGSDGHLYLLRPDRGSVAGWTSRDLSTSISGLNGKLLSMAVSEAAGGTIHLAAVVATPGDSASDSLYYLKSPDQEGAQWVFCGRQASVKIDNVSIGVDVVYKEPLIAWRVAGPSGTGFMWVLPCGENTEVWHKVVPPVYQVKQAYGCAVANHAGGTGVWVSYVDAQDKPHYLEFQALIGPGGNVSAKCDWPVSLFAMAAGNGGPDALLVVQGLHDGTNDYRYHAYDSERGLTLAGEFSDRITQLAVTADGAGKFSVYVLTDHNFNLHHGRLPATGAGIPSNPAILPKVGHFAVCVNADQSSTLFVVGFDNTLWWATRDQEARDWQQTKVETRIGNSIECYETYSTVLSFTRANGLPAVFAPVRIASSALALMYINGESYVVDSRTPAICTTNAAGQIVLSVPANRLATPTLSITADFLPAGQSIEIQQNAGIRDQLRTISTAELQAARTTGGKRLLPASITREGADAVRQALNQIMSLGASAPHPALLDASAAVSPRQSAIAITRMGGESSARLGDIHLPSVPAQSWEFDLTSGRPEFRNTTAGSISAAFLSPALDGGAPGGIPDFPKWGDLWTSVQTGVTEIGKVVVTAVEGATKAVSEILLQIYDLGRNLVWKGAVTVLEQVFDLAEGIFRSISVFFADLFEWLGFLFDWTDILRTKDAIVHAFGQFIPYLQGGVSHVKSYVSAGVSTAKTEITRLLDHDGANPAGARKLSDLTPRPADSGLAEFSSTMVKNIFFTGLINFLYSPESGSIPSPTPQPDGGHFQAIIDLIKDLPSRPEFQKAAASFSEIGNHPDQIYALTLNGVLELIQGIVLVGLDIAENLLGLILDAMAELLGLVWEGLTAPWEIPFVADLYESVIADGRKLSGMELMALVLAIPVTVVYKSLFNRAPFPVGANSTKPEDDLLSQFQAAFTTKWLLQRSGIGVVAVAASAAMASEESSGTGKGGSSKIYNIIATFFSVCYGANAVIFGYVAALGDIIPPGGATGLRPEFQNMGASPKTMIGLSQLTLAQEWLSQLFSAPLLSDAEMHVMPPWENTTNLGNFIWFYQFTGALIDSLLFRWSNVIANFSGEVGTALDEIYGAIHMVLQLCWAALDGGADELTSAQNVAATMPEVFKALRFKVAVESSKGLSMAALAGIDVIFNDSVGALGIRKLKA